MFIALVGTRSSGKTTVQNYLVLKHGFKVIGLDVDVSSANQTEVSNEQFEDQESWRDDDQDSDIIPFPGVGNRESFLSMDISSPTTPYTARYASTKAFQVPSNPSAVLFATANEMLDFATRNWREKLVTSDLHDKDIIEEFAIRPFFMLVNVDAPIMRRYERCRREAQITLEDFVAQDDNIVHGHGEMQGITQPLPTPLNDLRSLVHLRVVNDFNSLERIHNYLDSLNIVDQDRLRPAWDTYFMRLASLASLRSNCMKRCVGAILVRNKRIVSTGYNGTARGLRNCNEGGCPRCNGLSPSGHALDECVCLHAEENALLEAGRERIGAGAVLYCNTCPCLRCTVKIIQTGVKEVVYNLGYRVDDSSAALFKEAGIVLRRHAPPP